MNHKAEVDAYNLGIYKQLYRKRGTHLVIVYTSLFAFAAGVIVEHLMPLW